MGASETDGRFACVDGNANGAALNDRALVLADLVALREIGIEVVLAREYGAAVDGGADGKTEADGMLDRRAVQHGQCARKRDVHGRGLRVGQRAKGARRGREDLAPRQELRVGLDADDDFPGHRRYLASAPSELHCTMQLCAASAKLARRFTTASRAARANASRSLA